MGLFEQFGPVVETPPVFHALPVLNDANQYNAVAGQNIEYIDPRREFDLFVSDPASGVLFGWHYQATFANSHKAWRAQNMVRSEFPHLKCKIMSKPRVA